MKIIWQIIKNGGDMAKEILEIINKSNFNDWLCMFFILS